MPAMLVKPEPNSQKDAAISAQYDWKTPLLKQLLNSVSKLAAVISDFHGVPNLDNRIHRRFISRWCYRSGVQPLTAQ